MTSVSSATLSSEAMFAFLTRVKLEEDDRVAKLSRTSNWYDWILYQWSEGFLRPLAIWFVWMFVGTMYFGSVDFGGNYFKGFYYSVNVGYSVGWGVLQLKYRYSKVFAGFYLFLGALFVLHYVAYLIKLAVAESDNVYEQLKIKQNIERSTRFKGWIGAIYVFVVMNSEKLFVIYVWGLFLFVGAFFTVCTIHWPWLDGFYYALTSMSTAGLEGIPRDSPDYLFLATGLLTAFGVPVMGLAVGNIGLLMVEAHEMARAQAIVNQRQGITRDEVSDLLRLKQQQCFAAASTASPSAPIDVGDIVIDKNEFIIASLVRLKVCNAEQIHDLLNKFDRVDQGSKGWVGTSQLRALASPRKSPLSPWRLSKTKPVQEGDNKSSNNDENTDNSRLFKGGYLFLEDV